ncbi:MAG TPA: T9SS type A sorting domain-containing protein [Chitinophagaceae bacterium]|nr:T9SS type A sorting domain-containing protein [Chitinophagaceae bacterium]
MSATIVILLCSVESSYAGNSPVPASVTRDTILISKMQSSKKHKVRLYPNADHRVLFFTASGEAGRVYQLYLFDMDGKLSKQIQIRNKETTVLTNIKKGSYLFEVFSDDERIENGQLLIK